MRFLTAIALTVIALVGKAALLPGETTAPVTFNKEILPILQRNCQECHRPGQIGPFSLLTYDDAVAWADTIR